MARFLRGALIVWLTMGLSALPAAEPPKVTAFFPGGGQQGTEVRVTLVGGADATGLQCWIDRAGIEFLGADGKDAVKLKIAAEMPTGTAWLRFYNADGATELRPFVVETIREVLEAEPNDTLAKSQVVAEFPVMINGTLDKAGEIDTYRVPLKRGETLVAGLAAKQTLGSPMDGILQIVGPSGFVIEQNDDRRGFDPRVTAMAAVDGDHFVRVFAFPANPDTSIRYSGAATYVYRLTLTNGPCFDRVVPGVVTANQGAKVKPLGWNLPGDASEIELPPGPEGLQPVSRAGWVSTAAVMAVSQEIVTEQEPNPVANPQAVVFPKTVWGIIGEAKDIDAWKFTAPAGQRIACKLTATSIGSELDAVLKVFDAAGKLLQEIDDAPQDAADIVLEVVAPPDGQFVLAVTDRFGHGGPGYGYALSVSEPIPDAVLLTASDAFVIQPDATLEIPVTIERRAGYALPLTISLSGLPEGITADAVVSEREGESAKTVKLLVKSTRAEPWSGPVRIAGRAEGDRVVERVALFTSPATGDRAPSLWLTARPKP